MTDEISELAKSIELENGKLRELRGLQLNIASISDIHLNHGNTPTSMIVRNMNQYAFPDQKSTHDLDIIFICGDVTDNLMDFASDNAVIYRKWVADLLWMCAKHKIKLRVLKGTPLHDWDQSRIFVEENENHNIGCDLKYITDIHIEHIEQYGIDVLYIPDEIRPTTDQTWKRVEELMAERNITKVDFAVMHGAFGYQLPDVESIQDKVHSEERYLSIVRHYIFIGHVHQHRPKGKIIPNGSFDRLAHGEEGVKGHVRLNKGDLQFIPNKGAMRYITLDVIGKKPDEILQLVESKVADNPDKFRIRLLATREDIANGVLNRLSSIYPNGYFETSDAQKVKQRKERQLARTKRVLDLPTLTRDNLKEELLKELANRNPERLESCTTIVENLIRAS